MRFETYCHTKLRGALERNTDLFPEAAARRILAPDSIDGKLGELFEHVTKHDIPLYVLIDEYDNFANTVLAHHGPEAYHAFTHGGGFYRNFFAALKAGAGEAGGLERLFVTGVSPITLDDVTSGFNIGRNVSLRPEFNAMLGFTEAEVRGLLETYRECGAFDHDVDTALDVMREWYDGYRFARRAEATVYNTDMVLYFLAESMPNQPMPDDLIDTNVRIDYGKLRHLLLVNQRASEGAKRLNGNFDLLRHVIGEGAADGEVQASFPLERLDRRENFLSLLHYFGLLSIRGAADGTPRLGIPNQTVRRLLYGHLRDAYDDVGVLSVDLLTFAGLMRRMAVDGEWKPVFDFLRGAVAEQTGVRDYLDGEKVIQGFLAAYFGISRHFVLHTELEARQGLRGRLPGAARRPVPDPAPRLPDRAEVPQAQRGCGRSRGCRRGSRGGGAVAALSGGRTPRAPVPGDGAVHGPGGRVPRVGDGVLRPRRRGRAGTRYLFVIY